LEARAGIGRRVAPSAVENAFSEVKTHPGTWKNARFMLHFATPAHGLNLPTEAFQILDGSI
jgi:hypothetical protein